MGDWKIDGIEAKNNVTYSERRNGLANHDLDGNRAKLRIYEKRKINGSRKRQVVKLKNSINFARRTNNCWNPGVNRICKNPVGRFNNFRMFITFIKQLSSWFATWSRVINCQANPLLVFISTGDSKLIYRRNLVK